MSYSNQMKKVRELRTEAYLEYLEFKYKISKNRELFTAEKDLLVKTAYEKYKEVEAKCDAIEDFIEMEQLERDTIQSMKCPY